MSQHPMKRAGRLSLALLLVLTSSSFGAPRPAPSKLPLHLEPSLKKQFIAACSQSFLAPTADTANDPERAQSLSHAVCECAADETKSQGATDQAVKRETEAILKDPKHPIQDQHVLDALRYCAILAFHGSDDSGGD